MIAPINPDGDMSSTLTLNTSDTDLIGLECNAAFFVAMFVGSEGKIL